MVFGALVLKLSAWCGAEGYVSGLRAAAAAARKPDTHLYNTLEFLMMGIMVTETRSASNKICIKYHLLHLVGILFPHINDVRFELDMTSMISVEKAEFNKKSVNFALVGRNTA